MGCPRPLQGHRPYPGGSSASAAAPSPPIRHPALAEVIAPRLVLPEAVLSRRLFCNTQAIRASDADEGHASNPDEDNHHHEHDRS